MLVTAGPTWIKIDEVRILTTVFTGATGLFIARRLRDKGCDVTLVVNNHALGEIKEKGIRVVPFRYFDELKQVVKCELAGKKYDAVIHSAAVSDYKLARAFGGKISSGKKSLSLNLMPAEKIIKIIRKAVPAAKLVQFKLEIGREGLIDKAYDSLLRNKSDLVVANAYEDLKKGYKAFLIDKYKKIVESNSKEDLADKIRSILFCGKMGKK